MIHVPVPRRSRVEERRFRVKVRLGVLRLDLLHECGVLAHQRLDDLPHRREHPRGFDEQHLRDALGKVVEDALDEKLDEIIALSYTYIIYFIDFYLNVSVELLN